jgi:hypothetical protein
MLAMLADLSQLAIHSLDVNSSCPRGCLDSHCSRCMHPRSCLRLRLHLCIRQCSRKSCSSCPSPPHLPMLCVQESRLCIAVRPIAQSEKDRLARGPNKAECRPAPRSHSSSDKPILHDQHAPTASMSLPGPELAPAATCWRRRCAGA